MDNINCWEYSRGEVHVIDGLSKKVIDFLEDSIYFEEYDVEVIKSKGFVPWI